MITADTIKCNIPTLDAVNIQGQELSCTTSLIASAKEIELMWIAIGAIGAFGSLIVTIFMARYAWKAWNTAKKQLEHSENEAVLNRRQMALIDFLRILRRYFYDSETSDGGSLSEPSVEDVRFASEVWLLSYPALVKNDSLWGVLLTMDGALRKMKGTHSALRQEDIEEFPRKLRDQLEEVHIRVALQSRYVFDEISRVALELHRGERNEAEVASSFASLENATKSVLRGTDEVIGLRVVDRRRLVPAVPLWHYVLCDWCSCAVVCRGWKTMNA